MPSAFPQREFSIERRVRRRGSDHGPTNADILRAIESLRAEVAALGRPPAEAGESGLEIAQDQELRVELAQMVRSIARAKAEIAAIKHPKADTDSMHAVSSELDAIVVAAETATNRILEAAEEIEKLVDKAAADNADDETVVLLADRIGSRVVAIFEACNFQDITGQRIDKVVRTLRFIEARILAMIDIWGKEAFEGLPVPADEPVAHSSDELVNGPQLENQGLAQAEIDALFD